MAAKVRWGIIGTGNIASKFAAGLQVLDDAELAAVGSRSLETANAFGDKFDVPRRHATYEALAGDPDVDAVYIATPHPMHRDNTILCLGEGKAVLCEKPFAINAIEAREMVDFARARGTLLVEAMWTRFVPVMQKLRELMADGAIGEPRMVCADFGFRAGVNPESRLFNPALGGGALLDVGVYPVSLAHMVFGAPVKIAAVADIGETGVDEQAAMSLLHKGGGVSVLSTAIRTSTPQQAWVIGTEGIIRHHAPWWQGKGLTVKRGDNEESFDCPYEGNGYNCEAQAVMDCLKAGELESEVMPLDETVAVMETLDEIRSQWGLKYPME